MNLTNRYLYLLRNKDFTLIFTTIFVGQIASAFLVLTLIISLYEKTGSGYAVSGVILSFTVPGLFLMSAAGLAADVFDRKKIIVLSNTFIALVVFAIVFLKNEVIGATLLSSLYFAGNTFFLPAASAATAQIAGKGNILVSNIFFIFTFGGGLILGFFLTSVVTFFWGSDFAFLVCFELLVLAAFLSLFLPPLVPKKKKEFSLALTVGDVLKSFVYIFSKKAIWFYFVIFALSQGIIAYAATLAPGFFHQILGFSLRRTLIFVFPLIGLGAVVGSYLVHRTKRSGAMQIQLGILILSVAFLVLGGAIKFAIIPRVALLFIAAIFLVIVGIGDLMALVASRISLQKQIAHNYQGTIFGTNIILASVMASGFSLIAAELARRTGYINSMFFAGVFLAISVVVINILTIKWKL